MFEDEKRTELNYIISNVPILYKYSRIESLESIVLNSSIVFKNPTLFNDPYDCYPGLINFDFLPDNFRQYLIEKYKPFLNPEIIKRVENSSDNEVVSSFRDLAFPTELSNIAITCFSEKFDNLLMWSHYSNAHKGICIGFDLRKLYLSIENFHPALIKVKYTDEFVRTDYFTNTEEAISNWYRFKSECWSYEKEIRIILTNLGLDSTKQIYIPINKESINTIYLGSKIESKDENHIRSLCTNQIPEAKVLKMHLKNDSFNLIAK
jgi:hypothetical protein